MVRHFLYTITLMMLLMASIAFPAEPTKQAVQPPEPPKPDLSLRQTEGSSLGALTTVTITNAPREAISFAAKNTASDMDVRVSAKDIPVDLLLLVDTSGLCQARKLDKQMAAVLSLISERLHPQSRLSLATYTGGTLEILARSRAIDEIQDLKVDCEPKYFSASYQRALKHLLEKHKAQVHPTALWVFTSGNIDTSAETVQLIRSHNIYAHYFLYNPVMSAEISPTIEKLRFDLGKERVLYTVVGSETPFVPEKWVQLNISADFGEAGSRVPLVVSAKTAKGVLASRSLLVEVPRSSLAYFLYKYRVPLANVVLFLVLLYISLRLYKFYQPKSCVRCKATLMPEDPHCYFCADESQAYLVGKFNLYHPRKQGLEDIHHITQRVTEIGTHKRSVVAMIPILKRRKGCFAKIIREHVGPNDVAYRLIRTSEGKDAVLRVNGNHVGERRYLASGDLIQVGFVQFRFITGLKETQHGKSATL